MPRRVLCPPKQREALSFRASARREASALGVHTGVGIRLPARRCRADGTSETPSPTRGSTYRPVGRGPRAPPPGTHFSAGHMGPALQVHTPPKKQRGAPQGAPSPTGGAMWASSPTERRRGVPYRRRSQDMLATARPPMRTVTAPSFSYRRLRISLGLPMCSPCKNTFSRSGFTSPRR